MMRTTTVLLALATLLVSATGCGHYYYGHRRAYAPAYYNGGYYAQPTVVYQQPQPVYVQQQPTVVYQQPAPVVVQQQPQQTYYYGQ